MRVFPVVLFISLISGCGGRVADPVPVTKSNDDKLTCAHIKAEKEVNQARVLDLAQESEFSETNNIGLLLVSPLFLDLSDGIQSEIRALSDRNIQLEVLANGKGCPQSG